MSKLPLFNLNECKIFKFTLEEYYKLEIEYNRYTTYKSLITQIESIFKIVDSNESNIRKKYENKNIIDRFILECINNGISPHITYSEKAKGKEGDEAHHISKEEDDIERHIKYESLSRTLFFNNILDNVDKLQSIYYFTKMISEYNEKKLVITPERILNIKRAFIDANKKFIMMNTKIQQLLQYPLNTVTKIDCSITLTQDEYYVIRYRDYKKTINYKRYQKLIKNYDRPYPYDLIRMILRYSIFDMSNQQWSIGDNLYEDISEIFNISFEMFASPLNFNMNMFCSIFLDTDHIFGSIGSFYNLTVEKLLLQNIKGVFFNPPYLPLLMKQCTSQCINILDEMNKFSKDFTIISFLPNWADADYIKTFISSKYVVEYKIVNKGNYILHEKDKGKLLRGTFDLLVIVLNSMKIFWNDKKKAEVIEGVNSIVKIMKEETRNCR